MGLEQLALALQLGAALVELAADLGDRALDRPLLDVVVGRRPDRDVLEVVLDQLAGERVEVLELARPRRRTARAVGGLRVRREDLERLAADAERAAGEGVSLRVYWMETSLRSSSSRSTIVAASEDQRRCGRTSRASRGRRCTTRWRR